LIARDAAGDAESLVIREFAAERVILTDSGTSALVLALRTVVPRGSTVALPAYACVDLIAAARCAGARVRLYDVDPSTLSPDLDSVRAAIDRGVHAIVVAHLFGYPADVSSVQELATRAGVVVLEDAAQAAGGTLHGRRLGSLGDVSILSFGRGKGLCAGGGGALLFRGAGSSAQQAAQDSSEIDAQAALPAGSGWSGLAATAMQWALGRPSLYALPAMLPFLHLGEMIYRDAGEPSGISTASRSMIESALALERADVAVRRANAAALEGAAKAAGGVDTIRPIDGAQPGHLRYPIRNVEGRAFDSRIGIVRPYPRTLMEEPHLQRVLEPGEPPTPGAHELARTLVTLPTHRFISASDLAGLTNWIAARRV
jgi:dTDP-4-amino-4,6-dideoxygalactose transaminase